MGQTAFMSTQSRILLCQSTCVLCCVIVERKWGISINVVTIIIIARTHYTYLSFMFSCPFACALDESESIAISSL